MFKLLQGRAKGVLDRVSSLQRGCKSLQQELRLGSGLSCFEASKLEAFDCFDSLTIDPDPLDPQSSKERFTLPKPDARPLETRNGRTPSPLRTDRHRETPQLEIRKRQSACFCTFLTVEPFQPTGFDPFQPESP